MDGIRNLLGKSDSNESNLHTISTLCSALRFSADRRFVHSERRQRMGICSIKLCFLFHPSVCLLIHRKSVEVDIIFRVFFVFQLHSYCSYRSSPNTLDGDTDISRCLCDPGPQKISIETREHRVGCLACATGKK